jgi:hypothetical protein
MVLGFIQAKTEDVASLIASKNYTKAISLIRAQLKDVLVLAGKVPDAITVLSPLADEFARDGFAAKAISVLKKIQKLDPDRRDVDSRLAALIEEKQRHATVTLPRSSGLPEIGMEEIGLDLATDTRASVPARETPSPELGMEAEEDVIPLDGPAAVPAPEAVLELDPVPQESSADDVVFSLDDPPEAAPAEHHPAPVVDRDLITEDDLVEVEAEAIEVGPQDEAVVGVPETMTESVFAEELLSLVEHAFKDVPPGPGEGASPEPEGGGTQIVVSPLFKDLSVDELVAVIQGLKLLTFERNGVILREGHPGDSMYMLTSGTVRAFVKKAGKQVPLGDLSEGAFFGEISVLTGKPRTATVVATNHCELLELDRTTLDNIAARHPHVMDVLRQFAAERSRGQA